MEDIFIFGKLHVILQTEDITMYDNGITIHVKGDVIFHQNPNDVIILEGGDQIIEDIFDKYKICNLIAFSNKFGTK